MHNLKLCNLDTDSISVCKLDGSPFSEEEQENLLKELNSIMPSQISWDDDGYYTKFIVLMAKNYVLYDGKKVTYKGSAIKAKGKAPALQLMIKQFIDVLLYTSDELQHIELQRLYLNIAKEISSISDIKRWASRKTLSATTFSSERTNETKIIDAIVGTDYVEGDRIYTYYKEDGSLGLVEHFDGKYDKVKLWKDLYNNVQTFEAILPIKELFVNYSLKKNQRLL